MFEHLRRLFRHSVVYGLAETISRGTGFVLGFIYLRVLSQNDVGIRTAVYGVSALIAVFYTFGLDNAFLRYFMDKELADKKREIFSNAFYFSALLGFLFLSIAFVHDDFISSIMTKNSSYTTIVRLLFIILIFDNIVIYPTLVLRAENRLAYFSLIAFSRFFLFIFLNLLLVWVFKRGLTGVFGVNLIVVIIISVILIPVFRTYLCAGISFSILKRMLAFGVPTIFTILCMRVIDLSDRLFILYMLGESGKTELGKYYAAYTLGMVGLMVFVNSFRLAWHPFYLSIKDNPDTRELFSRVATYYFMFIGMIFLGIALFREEIFTLYAPPQYPVSLSVIVPVISLAYVFFGFYIIMLAGIFVREKTRYLIIVTFVAASANVGLNMIFIPAFGIIGAAYATVIAYIIMAIMMYMISHNLYQVNYDFKRIGVVLLITTIPIGLTLVFEPELSLGNIFFRGALFMFPPSVYLFSDFLLPEERSRFKEFFNFRLNKHE